VFRRFAARPSILVFIAVVGLRTGISAGADVGEAQRGLNFAIPYGWRVGYRAQDASRAIVEIVPQQENVQQWTRMITIQKYANPKNYQPESFIDGLADSAKLDCPRSSLTPIRNGKQNGFQTSQKIFVCKNKIATGAATILNMKAIQGKQYFYVIQIIYRRNMTEDELVAWLGFLGGITVTPE